jgi:8-oxo-dGTP diphosphatase
MTGSMTSRKRAAAVIIRDGRLLMVRQRGTGPSGRHDGQEYWTLPGGGIQRGETPEQAVMREVAETGLEPLTAGFLYDVPHPSGWTACYRVVVAAGEPRLGSDDDLGCDCPRMIGLGLATAVTISIGPGAVHGAHVPDGDSSDLTGTAPATA